VASVFVAFRPTKVVSGLRKVAPTSSEAVSRQNTADDRSFEGLSSPTPNQLDQPDGARRSASFREKQSKERREIGVHKPGFRFLTDAWRRLEDKFCRTPLAFGRTVFTETAYGAYLRKTVADAPSR
jgi:hypothetical protein